MMKRSLIGRLPRLFVNILAMDSEVQDTFLDRIDVLLARLRIVGVNTSDRLTTTLRDILDLPKEDREEFAAEFDRLITEMVEEGVFERVGEQDPRKRWG